jgi:adenine/guanine phosphoribosyltransferase-like PRPP-binding protein
MPYVCTEAGALYGEQGFVTERESKSSYLLFYTFGGTGFVRQKKRTVTVRQGQMLLMDCRMPQAYGTSPKDDHWYHLWAHVDGAGVDATAKRLGLPTLTPIAVSRSRLQPHFDMLLERLEGKSVTDGELVGLAVHGLLSSMLIARSRDDIPSDSPVVLAQNYVAAHFAEPITVDDIARAASVSSSYLTNTDRVLLVDDFLANGQAIRGLMELCEQAGAEVVGVAIAIEKCFTGAGDKLRAEGVHVESLALVESMEGTEINFRS